MSGKLDQSLDDIVSSHRRGGARGRGGRRVRSTRQAAKATPAPVGGVKKAIKQTKPGAKGVPTGPAGGIGDSKIMVSNLPKDVSEAQIKEYFGNTVGPIKKVEMAYGPGGVSRGTATIIFVRNDGASKAVSSLNGILIDGKPIKIDVILDARTAASIPPPKGLSERITAPKAQPKSAATTKASAATAGRGGKAKRGGRGGKNARPAKKTAEELDSEMADYWTTGATATEGGAAQPAGAAPATNGDAPMEDEIL